MEIHLTLEGSSATVRTRIEQEALKLHKIYPGAGELTPQERHAMATGLSSILINLTCSSQKYIYTYNRRMGKLDELLRRKTCHY